MASVHSLKRTKVNCDGVTIVALTPPRGMGMPLAALTGHPHSSAYAKQEASRFHWIVPRCRPGHQQRPGSARAKVSAATSTEAISHNWSGFTSSGSGYEAAEGAWNVPAIAGNCGSGCESYSSTWTGLGPWTGDATLLVQVGTESDNLSSGNSYFPWWQMCCLQNKQQIISNFPVTRGDSIFAEVYHNGTGTAEITFQDETTGKATQFQASWVNSGWVLGTYALWITERTEHNGQYPHLADFHQVNWTGVYAIDSSGAIHPLQSLNRYYLYMENCADTQTLAKTGDISNQTDFPDVWYHYGVVEGPC